MDRSTDPTPSMAWVGACPPLSDTARRPSGATTDVADANTCWPSPSNFKPSWTEERTAWMFWRATGRMARRRKSGLVYRVELIEASSASSAASVAWAALNCPSVTWFWAT